MFNKMDDNERSKLNEALMYLYEMYGEASNLKEREPRQFILLEITNVINLLKALFKS